VLRSRLRSASDDRDPGHSNASVPSHTSKTQIVGHTHAPFIRRLANGGIVANPGALLRDPAPGTEVQTPGTFAILDVMTRTFAVHRAKDGARVTLPPAVSRDR
jgi:predicted phosphodiesterase